MSSSARRRRAAVARANGKKSRGPVTPEGKARSAANSTRHGLSVADPSRLASSVCLTIESRAEFLALHQTYVTEFAPTCPVEHLIVDEMAVARWRLQRAWVMETALFENQMDRMTDQLVRDYETMNTATRLTLAFRELAESSPSAQVLHRYETRLSRQIERCEKRLLLLRKSGAPDNAGALGPPASLPATNSTDTNQITPIPDEPTLTHEQPELTPQCIGPALAPAGQSAPAALSGRESALVPAQPSPALGPFRRRSEPDDLAARPEPGTILPQAA